MSSRGGARPGAGRHSKGDKVAVTIRLSKEAAELLKKQHNQSEYIEKLIISSEGV